MSIVRPVPGSPVAPRELKRREGPVAAVAEMAHSSGRNSRVSESTTWAAFRPVFTEAAPNSSAKKTVVGVKFKKNIPAELLPYLASSYS